ncbi:MAG: bifunctional diaminohydroxyphosphoribosylaminopyrimidine deaminase/5-amino-6-(5-phosphoribosylamino)uracil reductase RibD [Chitinophagaceae bacterium]|nr:MAG: bifunctional diaminohydroxyphosphoribosylaminopyrimidine deaminase/5-amino-6-(5-phosphoribosylamino)uracil reductase RibD [Chitinophagaceae bacterium]
MANHELYMNRCQHLAKLGAGRVAPNPMVGALLVCNEIIIGEGYHEQYGHAHAEVNCINSVAESQQYLIKASTLYVSLEPCSHYGKTPPCSSFILKHNIRRVVVACSDPFEKVDGSGIRQLRAAGVEVIEGVLEKEARELNRTFFTFHQKKRPFIVLKWAQTMDGFISASDGKRLSISNNISNVFTHKMRAQADAILVGTNTAFHDNPKLDTRHWPGSNPLRIVVDVALKLPAHLHLFSDGQPSVVLNFTKEEQFENVYYHKINQEHSLPAQLLSFLHKQNKQCVMVEGGSILLQSFIDQNLWDEAVVITNTKQFIEQGLKAPKLPVMAVAQQWSLIDDQIKTYRNP